MDHIGSGWREVVSRRSFVRSALGAGVIAGASALALTGCDGNDLRGKTLYSVPAWSSHSADAGDTVTLTFGEDGDSWHFVPTNPTWEQTGTWEMEGDRVVLSSPYGSAITLAPLDGEEGYAQLGEAERFGTRFYPNEGDAQAYYESYVASAPDMVRSILEGATFEPNTEHSSTSKTEPETISFEEGGATFTRGEYSQEGYIFRQGPKEGSWAAQDHSGPCEIAVGELLDDGFDGSGGTQVISGTLSIGGSEAEYRLTLSKEGNGECQLEVADMTFQSEGYPGY